MRKLLLSFLCFYVVSTAAGAAPVTNAPLSFPGAVGWGAVTPGGRGGKIIRVTNLNAEGPGSFKEAVETAGPRIVVFEVGGVIDMGRKELEIREPFLTIAGQTAPSPGITLIRTGIDLRASDVIVRHIRIRTGVDGQAKRSGWEPDAFNTVSAHRVVVDHCTFSWAIDESMSASGPRFKGNTPEEWRANTSGEVTFSYNLASEGLADASHPKGEHSKGSLCTITSPTYFSIATSGRTTSSAAPCSKVACAAASSTTSSTIPVNARCTTT